MAKKKAKKARKVCVRRKGRVTCGTLVKGKKATKKRRRARK